MKFIIKLLVSIGICCTSIVVAAIPAEFPKQVEFVIPYPPGGVVDNSFRHLQKYMSDRGIIVVPSYKPGANGTIAHQDLSRMAKDGSAMSITAGGIVAAAERRAGKKLAEPITITGVTLHALVTYPGSNYETFAEFETALNAGDKGISIGWHAIGHLMIFNQLFTKLHTTVKPLTVPFKSPSESANAVIGKHISMAFIPMGVAEPLVTSGKLKLVVVTGPTSLILPKSTINITKRIPTWQANDAFMIAGPAGMDQFAIDAWVTLLKEYMNLKETREFYRNSYLSIGEAGPKPAADLIKRISADMDLLDIP